MEYPVCRNFIVTKIHNRLEKLSFYFTQLSLYNAHRIKSNGLSDIGSSDIGLSDIGYLIGGSRIREMTEKRRSYANISSGYKDFHAEYGG